LHLDPEGLTEEQRSERRHFVASFQQLTAPVMAKGLEDTSFYRYYPLASLAEVGGNADRFWENPGAFHTFNAERLKDWPHGFSATSTHDNKRDEDVRARIDVLSELSRDWEDSLLRWQDMNRHCRESSEGEAPDSNEEYLLYQTLLGTWPPDALADGWPQYVERIQSYMAKALREAKCHTSWVNPRQDYEKNVSDFVQRVLSPEGNTPFLQDLGYFADRIARPAFLNAVSQMLLKVASPGVPDFYQGTELPEFRLVDPDNRGCVDFERRLKILEELAKEKDMTSLAATLLGSFHDGRLKLFCMWRSLRLRQRKHDVFAEGTYEPLRAVGLRHEQVVAFARRRQNECVVAVVGRFFTRLPGPSVGAVWGEDVLSVASLPHRRYRDALTGKELDVSEGGLSLAVVFSYLPFALLEGIE